MKKLEKPKREIRESFDGVEDEVYTAPELDAWLEEKLKGVESLIAARTQYIDVDKSEHYMIGSPKVLSQAIHDYFK